MQRLREQANAKLAATMAQVDAKMAKVDQGLDRFSGVKVPVSAAAAASSSGVRRSAPPSSPAPSSVRGAGSQPGTPSVDPASAAKAFESVPKGELVSLLVKTNGRCKQLEMRYAELKRLHETLLEEKRLQVATRGRAGGSIEAEREQIEESLRQGYEDRLQELEEQVTASGAIKKQLQAELARATAKLRDEAAARQRAEVASEAAAARVAELKAAAEAAKAAAEKASLEAGSARSAAAAEQATLLERVMTLQGQVAAASASTAGGGKAGAAPGQRDEMARYIETAEASRRAEREEALAAQGRLRDQLAAGEAALAEARARLAAAERAASAASAAAAGELESVRGELAQKDKALSRALSNYKEEVRRWAEKEAAHERAKAAAAAEAERSLELQDEAWQSKLRAAVEGAEQAAAQSRVEIEAELAVTRSTAATESSDMTGRLQAIERRAAAQVAAACQARDAAIGDARSSAEESRREAAAAVAAAEEAALRSKRGETAAARERDELSRKLLALQEEMAEATDRTSAQVERWAAHSASASEHEALVARLRQQLEESERSYRQAKGAKAGLEAEAASLRSQLAETKENLESLHASLRSVKAEAREAEAVKAKEAAAWKAKWKAQATSNAEVAASLEATEKRLMAEAAAHAATLATKDARVNELERQLTSGRPAEQQMFTFAREQAKRDEEMGRLRQQLRSLRDMLRESHKVLKHLMQQEQLLKEELKATTRNNERSDALNVEYLKNVIVAFLVKVYGDAEDEEHIKLARVLQSILHLGPEDSAQVNEKIAYYEASWWHRTANLLKEAPGAPSLSESLWESLPSFWGSSTAPPEAPHTR